LSGSLSEFLFLFLKLGQGSDAASCVESIMRLREN